MRDELHLTFTEIGARLGKTRNVVISRYHRPKDRAYARFLSAEEVAEIRANQDASTTELAKKMGVSRSTISLCKRGLGPAGFVISTAERRGKNAPVEKPKAPLPSRHYRPSFGGENSD